MIVNTVGHELDLSQGAVSSSLLSAAGPALQQECRTQLPAGQQMSAGQVIRTAGHQLHCKDVLHAACIKWDAGAGHCEQVALRTVQSVVVITLNSVVVVVTRSDQPKPPAVAIVRQNGLSSASCRASVAVTPVSRQIWWIQVVGGRPLARLHSCEGRSAQLRLLGK